MKKVTAMTIGFLTVTLVVTVTLGSGWKQDKIRAFSVQENSPLVRQAPGEVVLVDKVRLPVNRGKIPEGELTPTPSTEVIEEKEMEFNIEYTTSEEFGEVGDRGLLRIYETALDDVESNPNDYNTTVTDFLQDSIAAESKANQSLKTIDDKRIKKIEEDKVYREQVEKMFLNKLLAEIDKRQKIKEQKQIKVQGEGLRRMGIQDEMIMIGKTMGGDGTGNLNNNQAILDMLPNYLGKPYIWGGDDYTQKGIGYDCSGFTLSVLNKLGVTIPRVSAMQFRSGTKVDVNDLAIGDLVFFDTNDGFKVGVDRPTKVSHVGLYVGKGIMVHASSGSNRIRTEKVFSDYFAPRYMGARRYLGT